MRSFAPPGEGAPPIWIDLLEPTEDERLQISKQFKIHVPSRADLSEIESSSRLFSRDGLVCVSMPGIRPPDSNELMPPPLGFVLTPNILVTIRFSQIHGVEQAISLFKSANPPPDSVHVFVAILEMMVDYGADLLERLGQDVAGISRRSFRQYAKATHARSQIEQDIAGDVGGGGIGRRAPFGGA